MKIKIPPILQLQAKFSTGDGRLKESEIYEGFLIYVRGTRLVTSLADKTAGVRYLVLDEKGDWMTFNTGVFWCLASSDIKLKGSMSVEV